MRDIFPSLLSITKCIDRFTDAIGICVAFLILPLVAVIGYEVTLRYVFNRPTIWVFDLTYMLYAAIFMLGAAYALLKGAHIRTDFFFEKWSTRTKGVIDSVAYVVFFFPSLTVFLFVSGGEGWYAYVINEVSEQTPWRPILWPFKWIVPVTCLLLMIQGISEVIKSLYAALTGIVFDHKEKLEI